DAIVGQHRTVRRIDEEPRGRGDQEVAVSHTAAEQRVAPGLGLVHVGIELVAGQLGETLDVLDGNLPLRRDQRVADLQLVEGFTERMRAWVELARTPRPAA